MNRIVLVAALAVNLLSAAVYGYNDGFFELMIDALEDDVKDLQAKQAESEKQQKLLVTRIETLERWKRLNTFAASSIWKHVPERSKAWLVDRLEEEGWFGASQASPQRCYKGERGDANIAAPFHKGCDNKGRKTITFILAHDNSIFGAVTSVHWQKKVAQSDSWAYLMSLKFGKEASGFKLPVKPANQYALRGDSRYGPTFGGGADIYVGDTCLREGGAAYSNVGVSYVTPTTEQQSYMQRRSGHNTWQFTKSTKDIKDYRFECKAVEVWYLP